MSLVVVFRARRRVCGDAAARLLPHPRPARSLRARPRSRAAGRRTGWSRRPPLVRGSTTHRRSLDDPPARDLHVRIGADGVRGRRRLHARAIAALRPVFALLTLFARACSSPASANSSSSSFVVHLLAALRGADLRSATRLSLEHAEIMVRELQIIFGLDAVARELRVARHALVFLEQLGGVAALAIVLAVPGCPPRFWSPLSPTAAPAAALTIIDQMPTSLRVVAGPFGLRAGRARRAGAAPDPLVPVCASKREMNGRLRRGWDGMRSAAFWGAGPALPTDVVRRTPNAKRFRSNPG